MKNTAQSPPSTSHQDNISDYDPLVFTRNMTEAIFRAQQIARESFSKQTDRAIDTPLDPLNIAQAFSEFYKNLLGDPQTLLEQQQKWWQDYMELCQYAAQKFLGDEHVTPIIPPGMDRRFKGDAWQHHVLHDVIRQSYLLTSNWVYDLICKTEGLDTKTAQKVQFYTRQFMDALSPSNFIMTNPEVLQATLKHNGENILKGLNHLAQDLKTGEISMTDYKAFEVGKNVATTPGYVVYKNELMELIQYSPTTKQAYEVPILMVPAWINKYYILDLQEKSSLVAWLVSQGYTVFVISWVNPDKKLGDKDFADYMKLGPLAAMDAICKRTKCKQLHTLGYCLGGTLLAVTLAWLHAKGKAAQVASATYLTTMVDFTEAGDLSVFVDESQISHVESRMQEKGYLEGRDMSMTFNLLRANDLIWSFVVNNYLLGKEPFPFDLLYWNADSTRMPAKMHSFYMRSMYLDNKLVKKGGITMDRAPIDIRKITTPSFILSTREDHIAPWESTYAATHHYQGPIEFVLAASGHVAGVINPPTKNKYSYWTSAKTKHYPQKPETWFKGAKEHAGSWWPHWEAWLAKKSGNKVAARNFTATEKKKLTPAPGEYVKVRS